MSVGTMSWVWTHSPAAGNDLLVLLAIADTANDGDGYAYPKIETLAKKTRVSVRTVQRCIQSLVEADQLIYVQGTGRGNPSRFVVLMGREGYTVEMGDGSSPITERVTSPAGKGDAGDAERVTLLSQEPSVEPSGTKRERPPRQRPETELPEGFTVTPSMRSWAQENGITAHLALETQKFKENARARGLKYRIWESAWRTWMLRTKPSHPAPQPGQRPARYSAPAPTTRNQLYET